MDASRNLQMGPNLAKLQMIVKEIVLFSTNITQNQFVNLPIANLDVGLQQKNLNKFHSFFAEIEKMINETIFNKNYL
jgi:hypothetical protein